MKIKALIPAALFAIVGSSSLAMARPITISGSAEASWSWGTNNPVVIRDHRPAPLPAPAPVIRYHQRADFDRGYDYDYYRPRFQTLDQDLSFGYTEYRKDIWVGADKGRFDTLRIDSEGGYTYLMKVVVEFTDNSVQNIQLNRSLRGNQSITLPLDARKAIHRVFVYRADGDAALNMRSYHNGSFTVSAL